MTDTKKLAANEGIKTKSNFLRGSISQGLKDLSTGALAEDDTQLTKFHGIYQQDDRDIRTERIKKKLEKAYSFMIRVRVAGGKCSPEQWLKMDEISDTHANGTIKLTTRQAFQFHGIIKSNLKHSMQDINSTLLDTLAACGDVNRNVMCNVNANLSKVHADALKLAEDISNHLTPATSAYHEIWLTDEDGNKEIISNDIIKQNVGKDTDEEPLYGATYLPRKFKTVVAVPPSNDVDIFAHCLGFIAIVENGKIIGYNVTVGGGMGSTHGDTKTYPCVAKVMGFCKPEDAVKVAEGVLITQRDNGDRVNRKHSRLKYTVEDMGLEGFTAYVEKSCGIKIQPARPFEFTDRGDPYGWVKGDNGKWHYTQYVQNGRVKDTENYKLKEGLKELALAHKGDILLTNNQNVTFSNIAENEKSNIQAILDKYKIDNNNLTGLRLQSLACVSLPTCALGLAESERYLPDLIDELDNIIETAGLKDDEITIRMTGCPNGCARPFLAEIGMVGTGPNKYNLYLGAAFNGSRLNQMYRKNIINKDIAPTLEPIIKSYALERNQGEHFGDFVIRKNILAEAIT